MIGDLMKDSNSKGVFKHIAPHAVCCGGMGLLILASTTGLGAWLASGGAVTIGLFLLLAVAGMLVWRRRSRSIKQVGRTAD